MSLKLKLLLTCLCLTFLSYSQEQKVIFFDADWEVVEQSYGINFFRTIREDSLEKGIYILNDYYLSGKLQMSGYCDCRDSLVKFKYFTTCNELGKNYGELLYYFESGAKSGVEKYQDGKIVGKSIHWYESGKIKTEHVFSNGSRVGEGKGWYENGQMSMKANFLNDKFHGHIQQWHKNGQMFFDGFYDNQKEIKNHRYWYDNG